MTIYFFVLFVFLVWVFTSTDYSYEEKNSTSLELFAVIFIAYLDLLNQLQSDFKSVSHYGVRVTTIW